MPGTSVNSRKRSGSHLNDTLLPLPLPTGKTANILPPTQWHSSAPHLMSIVAPGSVAQYLRSESKFMFLQSNPLPNAGASRCVSRLPWLCEPTLATAIVFHVAERFAPARRQSEIELLDVL